MKTCFSVVLVVPLLLFPGAAGGADYDGAAASAIVTNGVADTTPIHPEFAFEAAEGEGARAACSIVNMQGTIAAGYLNWPVPGGGMGVYFDPEGVGGSDPGCGANPYSFLIESVDLEIAPAGMFSLPPAEGHGTLTFTVGIECPGTDGEPCSQPTLEIFVSDDIVMVVDASSESTLRQFNVPVDACVDGPFFVVVEYKSWTGASDRVASLLWDGVVRPSCRQWITTDGGSSWTDHEAYFTEGDTGWGDFVVHGNTQDACGPSGNCGGPPPIGACCLPDGSCLDDLTAGDCEAEPYEGEWQGADTVCATVECPQPPPGACCDADGYCTEETEFTCVGTWLGADTVCGPDCDEDGKPDACVIALGMSLDCQPNDIPDECDLDAGTSADINENGVPDECECPAGNGDDTGDNFVDLDDYLIFAGCLDGPQVVYQAGCEAMDMDGDCDVDLVDAGLFQVAFNEQTGPDIVFSVQLAGNTLGEYPFFEYIKAFNENAALHLAIDPTRFPDIVGRTCDLYVVDAKTWGQWQADPSLVDVTAGGAQTETFGGTTIQENTFTVAGPYELDSAVYDDLTGDYTGLGAPYDMVIDCNRNGQLDSGDYIDGFGKEAGLYMVHNTSQQGPLAVTELLYSINSTVGASFGIPSDKLAEDLYYPTDVASMGELPLVIVSRGNGHNYQWYDHIGYHMASYGYVVMSHDNNTEPGVMFASLTTLGHTDAFLDQLGVIAGGALVGHVDSHHIVWIGHSRGAEGVAIAYDRITDTPPSYTPTYYTAEDIVLIDSMLPTDFQGTNTSNPHEANYHLWTASGDDDVSGTAGNDIAQTFHLHDRATRFRQSTVVQGTGHGDFHTASGSVFCSGCPCHIVPQETVHEIMQGLFLPMIKHYVEGNIPGTDFLTRQYEHFHPIGVDTSNPCIVVSTEYRNGAEDGNFMIDDYQTEYDDTHTSSSGGSVTYTVQNLTEGRLDDNNSNFTWTSSDPFNGATQGRSTDTTRGVVFDWTDSNRYYEWEIITEQRDLSDDLYLSFRGAQGTQHPNTLAVLGDLTFSVTLRDGAGTSSSINIGAYGGGFEQPYQRLGGWHNEMEVIRIRLTDFLTNGSGLDLTDIVAVRLNFGPSWGSDEGRIVVDELMLTNDHPPFFIPLTMELTSAAPEYLPPGVPTVIEVRILEGTDTIVPDSALLHYRYDGGTWLTDPLEQVLPGSEFYEGTLPAPSCGDTPEFYISVEGAVTGVVYDPATGPSAPYTAFVGVYDGIFADDFEADLGWTVENDPSLTDGPWERAIPSTDGSYDEPTEDYDGSGYCYVTENVYHDEVDGGPTRLISPTLDLSTVSNPLLRYARWWANDDQDGDPFDVEISNDNGGTWVLIENVINIDPGWVERVVYITDYITPLTDVMKIRFSAMDNPNNSKDEGGVDAVELFEIQCSD